MRMRGVPEEEVLAYQERAMRAKDKKAELYRRKLEASVEPSVRWYRIRMEEFLGLSEPPD